MCSYMPGAALTILPNLGGLAGGYFSRKSIQTWYAGLKKPEWRPPNCVFGPVWTTLYTGMGYASYLVYKNGGGFTGPAQLPLAVYGAQLALNWAWSPIFFCYHSTKWALYEILVLDATVAACGYLFYQVNKTAGLLFIPYGLWLSLATALTYRIHKDNGGDNTEKIKEI